MNKQLTVTHTLLLQTLPSHHYTSFLQNSYVVEAKNHINKLTTNQVRFLRSPEMIALQGFSELEGKILSSITTGFVEDPLLLRDKVDEDGFTGADAEGVPWVPWNPSFTIILCIECLVTVAS